MFNDPEIGRHVTRPFSAVSIKLLGQGCHIEGVALTRDETSNLQKLYRIKPETCPKTRLLMEAGATRNMLRRTQHDGVCVMAVLAKHLEPDEDPVKLVLRLLNEAGYDCSDDLDWAYEDC